MVLQRVSQVAEVPVEALIQVVIDIPLLVWFLLIFLIFYHFVPEAFTVAIVEILLVDVFDFF